MPDNQIVYALHLCFAAICFFVLNYCWRTYRIDVYRQFVFDLRDELFDLASKHFGLDVPAYRTVREQLNACIRFAHRTNFVRLLFISQISERFKADFEEHGTRQSWMELMRLADSPELRERIDSIRRRFNQLTADRIASTAFPPLYVVLKLTYVFRMASRIPIEPIETQAIEVDAVEHQRPAAA